MTMIGGTEDRVELYLVQECEAHGALCIKLKPYLNGLPDRLILWNEGVTDFVETKRPKGGRFEPLQLRWRKKLQRRGHTHLVIITRTGVDSYVQARKAHWGRRA